MQTFLYLLYKNENQLDRVNLNYLDESRKEHPSATYLLPKEGDTYTENDYTSIPYTVIQEVDNQQTEEATLTDDDDHVLSRYKVAGDVITPVYSEGYY